MVKVHINDRVLVVVLFIVMAVLSGVTVVNLRETNSQTERLRRAIDSDRLLSEASIVCTLDTSGAVNTEVIPYTPEAIEKYVSECIVREAKKRGIPVPSSVAIIDPTTTTTTS